MTATGCIPVRVSGKPDEPASALCSAEDYEFLAAMMWSLSRGYAGARKWQHGSRSFVLMHRLVYERMTGERLSAFVQVDHINGNRLDNRRENLRPVDNQRNQQNTKPNSTWRGKPVRSLYKGVFWHHKGGKWEAKIGLDGRKKYLGLFATEEEAARAYDRAARECFGEYARCNFDGTEEGA